MTTHKASVLTIIGVLLTFAIAAIVALALVPADSDSTPFMTAIVGLVAPTVVALVALIKIEEATQETRATRDEVKEVHDLVNGVQEKADAIAAATAELANGETA